MSAYHVAPRARRDLDEIWLYIAADNESAADRFIDLLDHRFRLLGKSPNIGRRRDDLGAGRRSIVAGEYLIVYRVSGPRVVILRIVHERRDLKPLFG